MKKHCWCSKLVWLGVMIIIFVLGFWAGFYCDRGINLKGDDKAIVNAATFNCKAGKKISAAFYKDSVGLSLSDGRKMDLPQAMSASGARYANADEKIVFWNKGDTAFIDENGKRTFDGCNVDASTN